MTAGAPSNDNPTAESLLHMARMARLVAGGRTLTASDHDRIVSIAAFLDCPGGWVWASAAYYILSMARRMDSGARLDPLDVGRLRAIATNADAHRRSIRCEVAA